MSTSKCDGKPARSLIGVDISAKVGDDRCEIRGDQASTESVDAYNYTLLNYAVEVTSRPVPSLHYPLLPDTAEWVSELTVGSARPDGPWHAGDEEAIAPSPKSAPGRSFRDQSIWVSVRIKESHGGWINIAPFGIQVDVVT